MAERRPFWANRRAAAARLLAHREEREERLRAEERERDRERERERATEDQWVHSRVPRDDDAGGVKVKINLVLKYYLALYWNL